MPVVTTAALAISAAVAVTTAATVATAVVATSALIGTLGLGMTAVGMVTKNKDLMKAGKIAGYVGLAGGIAGFGMGAMEMGAAEFATHMSEMYSSGWDQGVGSLFAPDPSVTAGSGVGNIEPTGLVDAAQPAHAPTWTGQVDQNVTPGLGGEGGVNNAVPAAAAQPTPPPTEAATTVADVSPMGHQEGDPLLASQQPPAGHSAASLAGNEPPPAPVGSTAGTTAPTVGTTPTAGTNPPPGSMDIKAGLDKLPEGVQPPGVGQKMADWWAGVPDYMKAQMLLTAGQGAAGLASGWMTGLSAEQRLEFDKMVNEQNQQQRQLINSNNRYAPLISFNKKPGLVGAAGRPA